MLDVHPPHQSAHSWSDFFIHIATIVVGLLIAIGLEQTVEFLHHRHQLRETRRQLTEERDLNARLLKMNELYQARMQQELDGDMAALLAYRRDHRAGLAGKLHYGWYDLALQTGGWEAARENNTLALMTGDELLVCNYRYEVIAFYMRTAEAFINAIRTASVIAARVKSGNPDADDIRDLIAATSDAQARLRTKMEFQHIAEIYALQDRIDYSFIERVDPGSVPVPDLPPLRESGANSTAH